VSDTINCPPKQIFLQAAMNTHLSQSLGVGALVGQHGTANWSAVAAMDVSSAIAAIDASEADPAITGRESGANTSPAITAIARSRRIVLWRFTSAKSHGREKIKSLSRLTTS
jgi:hypothetical protein